MSRRVTGDTMPSPRKTPARKPAAKKAAPSRSTRSTPPRSKPYAAVKLPEAVAATKRAGVIAMLRRDSGASLAQLTEATGWQPHTVRAVISATLRKKMGLTVTCTGAAGERLYRIVTA